VTNGRYQELEFNGSFSAMNRKSGRSTPDPNPPYTFLQSGQSNKSAFYELDAKKAAFGDFNQSVNKRQ
jgi:hypothetical protein